MYKKLDLTCEGLPFLAEKKPLNLVCKESKVNGNRFAIFSSIYQVLDLSYSVAFSSSMAI